MSFAHHIKKHIQPGDYYRILIIRTIGNFLILASLFMIGKTFYQPVKEEIRYVFDSYLQKKYIVGSASENNIPENTQPRGSLSKLLNLQPIEVLVPQDLNYSILIPKIGANSLVVPNVNPAIEDEYQESLKSGVAHALGTNNPGEGGHVFLFAHSANNIFDIGTYNAVFYLLYKLEKGDEVNVFYNRHRYTYRVIDKMVVEPHEVEYLTRKTDSEFLTLQTCYPPGTTLKRLLVFAVPVID